MADIFISYQHQDRAAAEQLAARLGSQGLTAWWDTSLVAGEAWTETIRSELKGARVVLVLWSSASWLSRWVQAEAQAGHDRDCLVAARLDDVGLEPPFNIVQTADLRAADGFDRLLQGIKRKIGAAPKDAQRDAVIAPATTSEPTLVVLPFDNLSNDPEMQFFSDGVSEEILQVLARGSGLRVIGRTSAFQFRGTRKGEAARMLTATHVLDGAVRKAGTRLRVSAELTEAAGGAALWSERYDQDLIDVFAVQDDVAAKVATALRSVLLPAARSRKIDPRAHELYLKAFAERSSVTDDGYLRALVLLEEVVALAPDFVDGWALLGSMRTMLLPRDRDGIGTPQHNAALAATRRALALDPDCAIGYWNLTNLKPAFGEYAEKIELARRAKELAPNDPLPVASAAGTLIAVGRCKDALADVLRSAALDPMNPLNGTGVARALENLGRVQEAHAHLDEVFKVQPPSLWTASAKFILFFNASCFAEAAAYLDASILGSSDELNPMFRFLLALPSLPQEQRVAVFQNMLGPAPERALALTECAVAARFGCADIAFNQLFAALDTGRPIIGMNSNALHLTRAATVSFAFSLADGRAFRADKRFARFCARVGLVEYWRTSGHWPDCADEVPYDFKAECEKAAGSMRGP